MSRPLDMRRLITLCEQQAPHIDYYAHVSPINNLSSIVKRGLRPPATYGNYTGYETALEGTYVTRVPKLIRDHINARMMENGFVLVVVAVASSEGVIDEDAIDPWLMRCIREVIPFGRFEQAAEEYEPDDPIWQQVAALFKSRLGQPDETVLQSDPDMVDEFVRSYILEHIYSEDISDGDWWSQAKAHILAAYPQLSHPEHGDRYSLRLPRVGYRGSLTRIVTVITVQNGQEKIVKGAIPADARPLVDACLDIDL